MKKKWLVVGGAVGISGIMMLSTGLSAMASTSGYDAYKSALKNTKTVKSMTVEASAALQDNGNVLANAQGSFKVSPDQKAASGSVDVTSGGDKQQISFYKQSNETVVKSSASDVYYVKPNGKERVKTNTNTDKEMPQQVETVIDALVGNLKDYVAVDAKADGSKQISIQLDNAQLPAVVNAIAPIAIKHAAKGEHGGKQKDGASETKPFNENFLKTAAPQLTQDIKIEKVAVKANVNASNFIDHQEADVTVSGKDDNGAAHQVTLHLQADLSGYNSTTPDTVDLTGKNVQQMKNEFKGHRQNNQ
ncbi:hypothetical protein [Paenibacillus piri]|uniref:Uncharacterized protein n=1 Tax=Paenibacillus piri TaxID=2547395 RepID=A0A4R5KJY1_9BACL|nr:hypothetical protein [Paenibacillus piri]TDF95135.1 hypothetical protein E1757_21610 [Paenibacillus piri]